MNRKPYFAYRSFRKELKTRKQFAELGIRQFCVFPANTVNALGQPYSEYDPIWLWDHFYNFDSLDCQLNDILAFCPDAEFLIMLDLNSPPWLVRKLQCKQKACDSFADVSGCLACDSWKTITVEYMKAVLAHIQEKYAAHIRCFILACGATDEWMDYSLGQESEDKLALFRKYCLEHQLPEPEGIPDVSRRYHSPHTEGCLRDPEQDRDALNYWKFHSDLVASGICDFASEARAFLREGQEIGIFYGYIMELGHNYMVGCGHLAYEKVLASGLVDFFISPGDYGDRPMGGGGGFQSLNGNIHLNQKHFLHELDHHTHTANLQLTPYAKASWWRPWPDAVADIAGLRREFCRTLLHGASLWWFDMWGGYYSDPAVLHSIGEMKRLWDRLADYNLEPDAEVALIADPEGVLYCNDHAKDNNLVHIFPSLQKVCNHFGAPYALYDISDLPKFKRIPKLAILPMWVKMDERRRELLRTCLPETVLLWIGPCGLSDGVSWKQQKLDGIVFPDYTAFTSEILRAEAQKAGVHCYVDSNLPLWATGTLLSCHSAESGTQTFHLKQRASNIVELFSGRIVAKQTDTFEYSFHGPETVLFEMS